MQIPIIADTTKVTPLLNTAGDVLVCVTKCHTSVERRGTLLELQDRHLADIASESYHP